MKRLQEEAAAQVATLTQERDDAQHAARYGMGQPKPHPVPPPSNTSGQQLIGFRQVRKHSKHRWQAEREWWRSVCNSW